MIALYQIADDYRRALDFDLDTEEDATALVELLNEIEGRFEDKAANVTAYLRNIEAEAVAYNAEAARLQAIGKRIAKRAESLKDYLAVEMRRCQIVECKAGLSSLKFVKNPWRVEIDPGAAIPCEYMTEPKIIPPAPDKKAIADAIKGGMQIEGVRLVQDERLRIA